MRSSGGSATQSQTSKAAGAAFRRALEPRKKSLHEPHCRSLSRCGSAVYQLPYARKCARFRYLVACQAVATDGDSPITQARAHARQRKGPQRPAANDCAEAQHAAAVYVIAVVAVTTVLWELLPHHIRDGWRRGF